MDKLDDRDRFCLCVKRRILLVHIREIQYILTIIEQGNITKAAKELYIAQSSLSQSLKKTEQHLRCKLFKRIGNKLQLTYAGERFVQAGSKIVKIYRDLENELYDISQLQSGNIIIGIPYYLSSHVFPIIAPIFRKRYPCISIKLIEGNSREIEKLVISGNVDVAILPLPIESSSIKHKILFQSRMILLMHKDNPLNEQGYQKYGFRFPHIDIKLADGAPFLLGQPGHRIRLINEIIFEKANISPEIVFMTRNLETIRRMASVGAGLAIMPDKYLDNIQTSSDLRCYFLEDEYDYQFEVGAAYLHDSYISEATKEFISIVRTLF